MHKLILHKNWLFLVRPVLPVVSTGSTAPGIFQTLVWNSWAVLPAETAGSTGGRYYRRKWPVLPPGRFFHIKGRPRKGNFTILSSFSSPLSPQARPNLERSRRRPISRFRLPVTIPFGGNAPGLHLRHVYFRFVSYPSLELVDFSR